MIDIVSILIWGFVATALLTTLMAGGHALGLSRMSIPYLLGTVFTPARDRAQFVGFLVHLVNGWIFAMLYAVGFESLDRATWWLGAAGGLLHGVFVLAVLMPMMPAIHPRMVSERSGPTANRQVQPPGFLALHYGTRTPLLSIVGHVCYGAVLGGFYGVVPG